MKALRFYGPRDIRYEEVPEPSPGPGQVKIKISLAGICGSDLKSYRSGSHFIADSKLPITMGHEFVGKVTDLGKGVTDLKVGDRVTGLCYWFCGECYYCKKGFYNLCLKPEFVSSTIDGCMAEYLIATSSSLFKLPNSLSDENGAIVEPMAVGIHAIRMGNVNIGNSVAIVGDGTIGLCALLAARAAGASEVYVIAKHKNRGELALTLGATAVIYLNDGNPVNRLLKMTGDLGADVVIECVGQPETPELAVNLARKRGAIVFVGGFENPVNFDFKNLMFSERTIVGSSMYIDDARIAIALMAEGRIDGSRLITSRVTLKDAVKLGFEKLLNDKENIKILIKVG